MNMYVKGFLTILSLALIGLSMHLEQYYDNYFMQLSKDNNYFEFTRDKNLFNIHVQLDESRVHVLNSFRRLNQYTHSEFTVLLSGLAQNTSHDAQLFIDTLNKLVADRQSFVVYEMPEIKALAVKCSRYLPSYIFYLKESVQPVVNDFEINLRTYYDTITDVEEVDQATKKVVALLAMFNLLDFIIICFMHNSIVFHIGPTIKTVVHVKRETLRGVYEKFGIFKKVIMPLGYPTILCRIMGNRIKIKLPDSDYSLLADFTLSRSFVAMRKEFFGKDNMKSIVEAIRENVETFYKHDGVLLKLKEVPGVNDELLLKLYEEAFKNIKVDDEAGRNFL